jgi:hypothetical protein
LTFLAPIFKCQGKRNTDKYEDDLTYGVPEVLPYSAHSHGVTPDTAKEKWHELLQRGEGIRSSPMIRSCLKAMLIDKTSLFEAKLRTSASAVESYRHGAIDKHQPGRTE